MADLTPTRGTALALAEENSFLETGFGFLDEKRMLLAATLIEELNVWKALRDDYQAQLEMAQVALRAAILRHGLEGLQTYPVANLQPPEIEPEETRLLGLVLLSEPQVILEMSPPAPAPDSSQEAENCREAFAALIPLSARLAARQSNLLRLITEYRATERRARALENVLLPEAEALLRTIQDFLDEADQEEAIRIRNAAR